MKKFLIALLLTVSTVALAEGNYASIKFETRNGLNGTQDANAYSLTVGQNVNKYLDAEVYARVKSNDDDTNNTRTELALVAKDTYGAFTPYVRGAVGEKFDGSDNHSYWSVEPGVKVALTQDWSVKAGLRFRDAFTTSNNDSTRTYRLGTEYAITKTASLSAGVDLQRGDSDYNTIGLGYNVKF